MRARAFLLTLVAAVLVGAPSTASAADKDLAVTGIKELSDPVEFGGSIRYTVTVKNLGTSFEDATVRWNLPANTSFGDAVRSNGTKCGAPDECSVGTIAAGGTATLTVFFETQAVGDATFTARVAGTGTDPDPSNDERSETTTIKRRANTLSVTLTDSPDPATAGGTITYTAVVTNTDPKVRADGVSLTLTPPSNGQSAPNSCSPCALGTLAPGASSAPMTLEVKAPAVGLYTATATVSSQTTNGTSTDSETTKVAGPPTDMAVDVADTPDPALERDTITYTITATNQGANGADAVAVTAGLPSALVLEDVDASAGTCTSRGAPVTVSCAVGTVTAGAAVTVTVKATTATLGDHTVSVSVDSAAAETDPADNAAAATTRVAAKVADLSVVFSDPGPVLVRNAFELGVTVPNPDPAPAEDVRLDIAVPEGVEVLAVTSGRATCGSIGNVLTCPMQRIGGGASPGILLRLRAAETGSYGWSATVTSSTTDPVKANNTASRTVTVVNEPPPEATPPPPMVSPPPSAAGLELSAAIGVKSVKLTKGIPLRLAVSAPSSVRMALTVRRAGKRRTLVSKARALTDEAVFVLRLPKAARATIGRLRTGTRLILTVTATGDDDSVRRRLVLEVARHGRLRAR